MCEQSIYCEEVIDNTLSGIINTHNQNSDSGGQYNYDKYIQGLCKSHVYCLYCINVLVVH